VKGDRFELDLLKGISQLSREKGLNLKIFHGVAASEEKLVALSAIFESHFEIESGTNVMILGMLLLIHILEKNGILTQITSIYVFV
jgi:hypothetical protein